MDDLTTTNAKSETDNATTVAMDISEGPTISNTSETMNTEQDTVAESKKTEEGTEMKQEQQKSEEMQTETQQKQQEQQEQQIQKADDLGPKTNLAIAQRRARIGRYKLATYTFII